MPTTFGTVQVEKIRKIYKMGKIQVEIDGDRSIVLIDDTFVETCATGTLTGILLRKDYTLPKFVILRFPKHTLAWCKENKGPYIQLMPEHMLPCLLEDMLQLMTRGIVFTIERISV